MSVSVSFGPKYTLPMHCSICVEPLGGRTWETSCSPESHFQHMACAEGVIHNYLARNSGWRTPHTIEQVPCGTCGALGAYAGFEPDPVETPEARIAREEEEAAIERNRLQAVRDREALDARAAQVRAAHPAPPPPLFADLSEGFKECVDGLTSIETIREDEDGFNEMLNIPDDYYEMTADVPYREIRAITGEEKDALLRHLRAQVEAVAPEYRGVSL